MRLNFAAAVVCAVAALGTACAGTPQDSAAKAILAQVKSADPIALAQEKPVVAVCAALKVMAAKAAEFGLSDLRTNAPLLSMGVDGAANWSLLNQQVAKQAGKEWLSTSQASQQFMRDYIVFASAISENLDPDTAVSTPEMTATKRALRSVQAGCTALFKRNDYALIN